MSDQTKPNHFFFDSLGDPLTCTGDHNYPTPDNEPYGNEEMRRKYQSRNSAYRWAAEHYVYYLGQRVLVVSGTRNGMLEGDMGTVTVLPSADQPYLGVQRDNVTDRVEPPGWSPGSGVIPLRRVLEMEINLLGKRIRNRRTKLKSLDALGRQVEKPDNDGE